MAAPSYTTDLTTINVVDTAGGTTNWTALGGGASGLNSETDYYIQGDGCVSKNGFTATTKGMIYNATSQTINTGDAVFMWVRQANRNLLDTLANGGGRLLIGSSTSDYDQFDVDGNNVDGSDLLSWVNYAVDPTATASRTTGTPTATTSHFGFLWKILGSGSLKGAPNGIDVIRQGRELRAVAGESGDYATFTGMAAHDSATARRYGILTESTGTLLFHGALVLGQSGTAVDFRDANVSITVLDDLFIPSTFNEIEIVNASSNVEWENIQIAHLGTVSPTTLTLNIGTFTGTACRFDGCGTTTFASTSSCTDTTWESCGEITHAGATLNGSTVNGPLKLLTDSQNENNFDGAGPGVGTFSGGTGHAALDLLTMSDGSEVTVNTVSGGVVTTFDYDTTTATVGIAAGSTVTQVSTSGTGINFSLSPGSGNFTSSVLLNYNVATDPDGEMDGMTFNSGGGGTAAIEFGTSVTSDITLRNIEFTNFENVADTNGAALKFLATSGSLNCNLVGCTVNGSPATTSNIKVNDLAGITVTIVISPVTITTNVKNLRGENIEDARVQIEAGEKVTSGLPFRDSISITRSGSTASVSHTAHGLSNGEKVVIRHADQQEYNGNQTISNVSANAYDFTVTGTPATPATSSYDHLINQQDETSYDNSPTTEGTFSKGDLYDVGEIITLEKGIKAVVDANEANTVIHNQTETSYDNTPTTEGVFNGGSGHSALDIITLEKGITVTVTNVIVFVVDQFSVNSTGQTASVVQGETLSQVSSTGSGTNFSLTVDTDNLQASSGAFPAPVSEFTVDSGGQLRRESVVSGTALGQISTTGSGTGFTLTPDTDNIDADFIGSTYVLNAELTDASGNVSATKALTVNQLMTGWARKSTASPYYKQANINFTADKDTGNVVNVTLLDDE